MTTIRRTYAYLIAFAGLAMLAVAAANLMQVLIDVTLQSPLVSASTYVRDTVSRYAAIALVGVPVWAIHWWWIQRWLTDTGERSSSLRRLYLYAVLAASALVVAFSVQQALSTALIELLEPRTSGSLDATVRPLAFTMTGLVVWLAHWRVVTRDRALVGEQGGSATLRRWYVYGAAFIGLIALLGGAQALVESLWNLVAGRSGWQASVLAVPTTNAVIGLGLWLTHWAIVPTRLPEAVRRADGVAVLRSVYLFLALAIGVVGSLFGLSQLLYYGVGRALGIERPGGVGGDLLQAAAGPASVAMVYGVAWAYQRNALRRQAAVFDEAPRQAGIRRLYTYLVALVALDALAIGVAGLLWTFGDVVFNFPAATTGEGWRGQVALNATLAIVGLPAWLLHWRAALTDPAELRSLARRLYLYLSLIGAMLTLITSLALALYRVIGLLLGETSSVELLTDLVHAAAVALVAGMVVAYHWRVLRADARAVSAAARVVATEGAIVSSDMSTGDDSGLITIDTFAQVDLRVGQIVRAERIANADKLLRLEVDLAEAEPRQLLAGIAEWYAPESLVGQKIIVVSNLQPRRLRGLESRGMLLAADADGRPLLATAPAETPNGARLR